jgi:23S rRNA (cytosine1962-C5)-methyltransferase
MYQLLDSGNGRKLEQFGSVKLDRPCAVAIWQPQKERWKADGRFDREEGWHGELPSEWQMELMGLRLRVAPTPFGHLGIFPEHQTAWEWLAKEAGGRSFLNLFGYTGMATLVAAKAGAQVCHCDASQPMVEWARENCRRNGLETAPVRWIVDDAHKFLEREGRRGRSYDMILLDPPTFGRGSKGEVFKAERDLQRLLELCFALKPKAVALSSHTPGWTHHVLGNLLSQACPGTTQGHELLLCGEGAFSIPCGAVSIWRR